MTEETQRLVFLWSSTEEKTNCKSFKENTNGTRQMEQRHRQNDGNIDNVRRENVNY